MSSTSLYAFNKNNKNTNPKELILPLPAIFGSWHPAKQKYFETPSSLNNPHSLLANSSSRYWVVPLPSTSHHGDPNTPSFASIAGNGGQPKVCIMILSKPEKKHPCNLFSAHEFDLILIQGVEGFSANSICQADLPGRNEWM